MFYCVSMIVDSEVQGCACGSYIIHFALLALNYVYTVFLFTVELEMAISGAFLVRNGFVHASHWACFTFFIKTS